MEDLVMFLVSVGLIGLISMTILVLSLRSASQLKKSKGSGPYRSPSFVPQEPGDQEEKPSAKTRIISFYDDNFNHFWFDENAATVWKSRWSYGGDIRRVYLTAKGIWVAWAGRNGSYSYRVLSNRDILNWFYANSYEVPRSVLENVKDSEI